ncbi:dCTP deaminase [Deefgea rivuli]|uniref:dCTP deaminase n=1 Tax=Deefgea rivuli TaxID=400948 RepID=UPI000488BFBA|nr:deoxycytidine deaminase [Deefgea rivuli]
MIFTPNALIEQIKNGKIIKNLSERELTNAEGVGFDLQLNTLSILSDGSGSLRVQTRRTPATTIITPNPDGCYFLEKEKIYLATTTEEFDLPSDLAATFFPRSTLFRSGIQFTSSILPAGYKGPMTFSLINLNSQAFEIEKGARFAHVVFHSVEGNVGLYRGQWQGGRISQPFDEGQV